MAFRDVQGQPAAVAALQRMAARGRVPGALLFLGPHHIGKRTAALALAQALNCERPADGPDACGACAPCRMIAAGAHPDVEGVAPEGQFIKIGQIRAVGDRLALNPLQARRRFIVLARAERLNVEAANAFLKTLEEPPADTTLVLCAAETALLPETIVSRCLPVRFAPLPEAVVRSLLERVAAAAPTGRSRSALAGARTSGTPEPALDGAVLDFAVRFAQGTLRPELQAQAGAWYALRDELLEALEELTAGGDLPGDRLARFSAKGSGEFVLEWLETWWRDVAMLAAGGEPGRSINADRSAALAAWPERIGLRQALACHRSVLATREALALNVNAALALEGLWLGFKHALLDAGGGPRRKPQPPASP